MSKELEALEVLEQDIKDRVILAEDRQLKLCVVIKQALLKAEKEKKIISGIEDYLNRRIKVEPLEDVRKAFIEIRNQLQVIKEVLEWFLKCDHW